MENTKNACGPKLLEAVQLRAPRWEAGITFPEGVRDLSLFHSVQTGFGGHAEYPTGAGAPFTEVQRPRRAADHSRAFSAEVMNDVGLIIPEFVSSWHSA
jgi:hypothetical protein